MIFNEKFLSVYCDASFYLDYGKGLIAFVVCDRDGNILQGKNRLVKCKSSMEAEFLSIQYAVRWLNFYQRSNLLRNRIYINIFNDNQSLIEFINDPFNKKCNYINKKLLESFLQEKDVLKLNNTHTSFNFKDRKSNKMAHKLTKPSQLYTMIN